MILLLLLAIIAATATQAAAAKTIYTDLIEGKRGASGYAVLTIKAGNDGGYFRYHEAKSTKFYRFYPAKEKTPGTVYTRALKSVTKNVPVEAIRYTKEGKVKEIKVIR